MFIIDIIPLLCVVSRMPVPAVGVGVKKPIAFDIPNSPVVLGLISHDPVRILNYKYSNACGVIDKPLLTHFVFGRS